MLLFIAAFHGNLFYVGSILTSPLVQEEEGALLKPKYLIVTNIANQPDFARLHS